MVGLTQKQQEDLNFAIQEYMLKNKYTESAACFSKEAQVDYEGYLKASNVPSSLLKDILERKWNSIARLKKQVMDLERQCKQLKESNDQHQSDLLTIQKEIQMNGGVFLNNKDKNKDSQIGDMNGGSNSSGDVTPREPEKMKLVGHRARVTRIQFHPIYTQIASSSEDASIKIWDYETGECEQTLREHTGMVNFISFSPNGENMASCSRDMTIKLWNRNKEQEFKCYKTLQGHDHEISCVEYVKPTGDYLISCSRDQTIRIWDSHNGFLMQTIQQHNEWVRRITQTNDGKMMASASKDETVIIWNLEKIKQNISSNKSCDHQDFIITIIDDHEHVIDCIKFAPEASCRTIYMSDYNKGAIIEGNHSGDIIDDSTGDNTRGADDSEFIEESKIHEGETSRMDGNKRMTTKEKVAKLKQDLQKRKAMLRGELPSQNQEIQEPEQNQSDLSVFIDTSKQEQKEILDGNIRDYIATGSRDKKIRIFETRSGKCVLTLAGHDNWITDLFFHPNGKYLISTADDKSIRIWDLSMGRCNRKIYNAHDHFICCFDMKGKLAATGSVDTSIKIWSCR